MHRLIAAATPSPRLNRSGLIPSHLLFFSLHHHGDPQSRIHALISNHSIFCPLRQPLSILPVLPQYFHLASLCQGKTNLSHLSLTLYGWANLHSQAKSSLIPQTYNPVLGEVYNAVILNINTPLTTIMSDRDIGLRAADVEAPLANRVFCVERISRKG